MPRIDLQITEKILWLASKPKRIKIAVGGRGSQKSTGVGDLMLMFSDQGERICCTREFQNSIDDSVHESLKDEIERLGLEGFRVLNNKIESGNGGQLFYKGLARNITSIKSIAGVDRLWIEEGESVSHNSLKVLTPSVRSTAAANAEGGHPPEIWITMNRASSAGAIAEKYLKRADDALRETGYYEDDLVMAVEVNWRDNPWFPPELEQERRDDFKNLSRAEYDHIWEGEYNDGVEDAIIRPEWFDSAIDAHLKLKFKPRGVKSLGFDPADEGADEKALVGRHGVVVDYLHKWSKGDVADAIDLAFSLADEQRRDYLVYDGIGIGAAVKVKLRQLGPTERIVYHSHLGSESPDNPKLKYQDDRPNEDVFRNKRAQYWWYLRDRFESTHRAIEKGEYIDPDELISIKSDCEHIRSLKSELCRVMRKRGSNTLIQVESKQEMRKRDMPSPNLADALVMTFANPPPKARRKMPVQDASWIV